MNLIWTATGGAPVTLGDDSVKQTITVEQLDAPAVVQKLLFFRGVNAQLVARGGDEGVFVAVVQPPLATSDQASTYIKNELARIGQAGTLAWGRVGTIFNFTGVVIRRVTVAELNGARLRIRYTFGFAAMA
jgi:hypothetical protein